LYYNFHVCVVVTCAFNTKISNNFLFCLAMFCFNLYHYLFEVFEILILYAAPISIFVKRKQKKCLKGCSFIIGRFNTFKFLNSILSLDWTHLFCTQVINLMGETSLFFFLNWVPSSNSYSSFLLFVFLNKSMQGFK